MAVDLVPDLIVIVEWATIVVTFGLMASGLPACVRMYKERSIENVPYSLFLISLLVSILSLHYGSLINNKVITFINIVAVLVWGAYIIIYVLVSRSKAAPLAKLLAVIGVYSAHAYHLTTLPPDSVVPTMGTYLIVWCTAVCLIPAVEIYTMVQERSSKSCDIPLLIGGTSCGAVWCLYGLLMNDANIYFPNILGLLVSAVKVCLMFVYGLPSTQTTAISSSTKSTVFSGSVKNGSTSKAENATRRRK